MEQEFTQDAFPSRQLMPKEAKARYSLHTDIGEARIVHSMSGKAKIVVVREQDRRRLGRLLMILTATVIGAVSWEAWLVAEQSELERQVAAASPIEDRMQVSEPAYLPEFVPSEIGRAHV